MPPAFAGFPSGANPYTPLPDAFLTSALPEIEDINEVKVTLHLFWLLYQKVGEPRCASDRELLADTTLRRGLRRRGDPRPYEERLRAALEGARARGLLLRVRVRIDDEIVTWYFFNTERSRAAVADLLRGVASPEALLESEDRSQTATRATESRAPSQLRSNDQISSCCTSRTSACSRRWWPKNSATRASAIRGTGSKRRSARPHSRTNVSGAISALS